MFYNHHGIALVAELLERRDELAVVPLMQTNRRFVKDVEHIDQLRTDLGRESDSLALTS